MVASCGSSYELKKEPHCRITNAIGLIFLYCTLLLYARPLVKPLDM